MARYRQYKKKPINLLLKETRDYYLSMNSEKLDSEVLILRNRLNEIDKLNEVWRLHLNRSLAIDAAQVKAKREIRWQVTEEQPPLNLDILGLFYPNQKFERNQKINNETERRIKNSTLINETTDEKIEIEKEMKALSLQTKDEKQIKMILAAIPEIKRRIKKKEQSAKIARIDKKTRDLGSSVIRKIKKETEYPFHCPYCHKLTYQGDDHVDHINPVANGGLSIDNNMVLVCENCNIKKGSKPLRKFCRENSLDFNDVCDRLENMGKWV